MMVMMEMVMVTTQSAIMKDTVIQLLPDDFHQP